MQLLLVLSHLIFYPFRRQLVVLDLVYLYPFQRVVLETHYRLVVASIFDAAHVDPLLCGLLQQVLQFLQLQVVVHHEHLLNHRFVFVFAGLEVLLDFREVLLNFIDFLLDVEIRS